MSLYLFLDMYLHSGEYHVGTVGIDMNLYKQHGFKLMAGAVASCALIGVAVGVGIIYGSLLISIGRNPSQRDDWCWNSLVKDSIYSSSVGVLLGKYYLLVTAVYSFNCSSRNTTPVPRAWDKPSYTKIKS